MALPVTFTGSDGANISTIGFTRFSGDTGTIVITDNNTCRPDSTASSVYYYYDTDIPGSADYEVQIDFEFKSTGKTQRFGVIGRGSTGAKTFYLARINFVAFASTANLQLFKAVAGTFTQLGSSYAFSVTTGTTGTIKLTMTGASIKAFLSGTERISVTDSAVTASGRAGIYNTADDTISNTTGFHFDNLNGTFAGGTTFNQSLSATSAKAASIAMATTFAKSVPAGIARAAEMALSLSLSQSMSATVSKGVSLAAIAVISQSMSSAIARAGDIAREFIEYVGPTYTKVKGVAAAIKSAVKAAIRSV